MFNIAGFTWGISFCQAMCSSSLLIFLFVICFRCRVSTILKDLQNPHFCSVTYAKRDDLADFGVVFLPFFFAFSFRFHRAEILSGFINSLALMVISTSITVNAIKRIHRPPDINTDRLMVSVISILLYDNNI